MFAELNTATYALSCGYAPGERLTGEGLGALRIGATAAEVKRRCHVLSDSLEGDDEGGEVRVLKVRIGSGVLRAEIDGNRVWRISTKDRALRTRDGFGAGSTLGDLRAQGPLVGGVGHGPLFIQSRRLCGLSFALNYYPSDADFRRLGDNWPSSALRRLPSETRVQEVLVVGCAKVR